MIAIEGGHREDAILELAQVRDEKQEERSTMDEKSKEGSQQLKGYKMSTSRRCASFRNN